MAIAVLDIIDCQDCVSLMEDWCNVTEETHKLWQRLNGEKTIGGDPDVQGRIEAMTEEEASFIAEAIYTIENKLRAIHDSSG